MNPNEPPLRVADARYGLVLLGLFLLGAPAEALMFGYP